MVLAQLLLMLLAAAEVVLARPSVDAVDDAEDGVGADDANGHRSNAAAALLVSAVEALAAFVAEPFEWPPVAAVVVGVDAPPSIRAHVVAVVEVGAGQSPSQPYPEHAPIRDVSPASSRHCITPDWVYFSIWPCVDLRVLRDRLLWA